MTDIYKLHERYLAGEMLTNLAHESGLSLSSIYLKFKGSGLPLRPIKKRPVIEFNGFKYYKRSNGHWQRSNNTRLMKDVWEMHYGEIPDNYVLVHRDRNKSNNEIGNIICLTKDQALRDYKIRGNQFDHKGRNYIVNEPKQCALCGDEFVKKTGYLTRKTKTCSEECRVEILKGPRGKK